VFLSVNSKRSLLVRRSASGFFRPPSVRPHCLRHRLETLRGLFSYTTSHSNPPPIMARSAADATRFTATGPYASSKPAPRASTISLSSPAPAGETPQQKVARLKDAARRAKLDQVSGFDKVVARGRVWADRVHRVTALSLITLTGKT